ncbi:PREDICTED: serine protease snake-like [Nicrophorus vespilloides]|uniref:Serine protease snake-like n=1 Tax=Nicrophorus vespilloides TaxID=110193 RepID=A0ABM1M2A2_NICVS|nr:PREDICTED: serine protease snake-like [Nicrophorus vespilloides]
MFAAQLSWNNNGQGPLMRITKVSLNMFHFYKLIVLLILASQVYMETRNVKCENATKFCENIWYCKKNSYPEKYKACGHDGLVDRVCCDPEYPPTKSRKFCDTLYKKIARDEYGKQVYNSTVPNIYITASIAALGHRNKSSTEWVCAGSLINNKFVITAAKCLNQSINIVRLGDTDLNNNDNEPNIQEYGVLRHIIHPKYNYPLAYNDIALIELNDTVTFTKFVSPICVYDDAKIREPLCLEIGYKQLFYRLIEVLMLSSRECKHYFDNYKFANLVPFGLDPDTQICASIPSYHMTCQSQLGAQLQTFDPNYVDARFLIGITTIPKPSSYTDDVGLYTKVSHYAPWIESIAFADD